MIDDIKTGMARAFFASAYAEAYDEAKSAGIDPGFSCSGVDWLDVIPADIDQAALHAAMTLVADLQRVNSCTVTTLYGIAEKQIESFGAGDRELTPELFGHYLAMQAMGSGVGLESFGDAVPDLIDVPYVEFSSISLSKDYFPA